MEDDTKCMECQCCTCSKSNTDECGNCRACNSTLGLHQMWDYSCSNYVRD